MSMSGGRIVAPRADTKADLVLDAAGGIVMAGGIDVHSHIAGGNIVLARLLLPELAVSETPRRPASPFATARGRPRETGRLCAMGYTTVVEPAMPPARR